MTESAFLCSLTTFTFLPTRSAILISFLPFLTAVFGVMVILLDFPPLASMTNVLESASKDLSVPVVSVFLPHPAKIEPAPSATTATIDRIVFMFLGFLICCFVMIFANKFAYRQISLGKKAHKVSVRQVKKLAYSRNG